MSAAAQLASEVYMALPVGAKWKTQYDGTQWIRFGRHAVAIGGEEPDDTGTIIVMWSDYIDDGYMGTEAGTEAQCRAMLLQWAESVSDTSDSQVDG